MTRNHSASRSVFEHRLCGKQSMSYLQRVDSPRLRQQSHTVGCGKEVRMLLCLAAVPDHPINSLGKQKRSMDSSPFDSIPLRRRACRVQSSLSSCLAQNGKSHRDLHNQFLISKDLSRTLCYVSFFRRLYCSIYRMASAIV